MLGPPEGEKTRELVQCPNSSVGGECLGVGGRERQLVACLVVFQPPCGSNRASGGLLRNLIAINNLSL